MSARGVSRRFRRSKRTPVRLTLYTETGRDRVIDGRLIGPHGEKIAVRTGTERTVVVESLVMAATWTCLARDWEPELVDEGEL